MESSPGKNLPQENKDKKKRKKKGPQIFFRAIRNTHFKNKKADSAAFTPEVTGKYLISVDKKGHYGNTHKETIERMNKLESLKDEKEKKHQYVAVAVLKKEFLAAQMFSFEANQVTIKGIENKAHHLLHFILAEDTTINEDIRKNAKTAAILTLFVIANRDGNILE